MSQLSDPRVLFAAERTLLAWNRTSISFMAFGFVVERFGLFMNIMGIEEMRLLGRDISLYIGIFFIALSVLISFFSILQHKTVMSTLSPEEIPKGYNMWFASIINGVIGVMGVILIYYVLRGVNL